MERRRKPSCVKSGVCAGGQAPACLPHPQTSTVTGQPSPLGPIGVSPAETTRCSASARNARDVQRAAPRDPKSIPPGPDLGALKPSPIQNHRRGQPRCAAGRLSGARADSARTPVRDPLREPPRTRRPPTSSTRYTTRSDLTGRSTKRTVERPSGHAAVLDPHQDPEVTRQPRRALGARRAPGVSSLARGWSVPRMREPGPAGGFPQCDVCPDPGVGQRSGRSPVRSRDSVARNGETSRADCRRRHALDSGEVYRLRSSLAARSRAATTGSLRSAPRITVVA